MGSLNSDLKVRVSVETKQRLQAIADARREGTNISDIAREAIGEYLDRAAAAKSKKTKPAANGGRTGKGGDYGVGDDPTASVNEESESKRSEKRKALSATHRALRAMAEKEARAGSS